MKLLSFIDKIRLNWYFRNTGIFYRIGNDNNIAFASNYANEMVIVKFFKNNYKLLVLEKGEHSDIYCILFLETIYYNPEREMKLVELVKLILKKGITEEQNKNNKIKSDTIKNLLKSSY